MEYAKINGIDKRSAGFMGNSECSPDKKEQHFKTLDAAYALGVATIDRARARFRAYGRREWMKTRGNRVKISSAAF